MRRNVLMAAVALAAVLPSAALAQETCEQRAQNRVAGTVVGGLAGALLGSAVSGHHHKTTGAVVGGLAGALIGNQVAKGPEDCQHAYGWYDNDGRWHANAVAPSMARGYYDQHGQWVDGRPADWRPVNDDRERGDWRRDDGERRDDAGGYPEFRRSEDRIRDEIRQGVDDGSIEPDDAHALMGRLHDIRGEEAREYSVHGWNLPPDDRMRLHDQLARLDREVDRIRDEP
ncbi:MAG: glycine zipper 2TM domain-containing protein [Alphaproteobacteria bacterium]|nr:glycine zipper 2TM domain-containing protein [Alphaproteobacteria bacterium]